MSGWTIITVRGKYSKDYEHSEYDDRDPYQATADIAATMAHDGRVHEWTTSSGHVHAYLNTGHCDWEFAEAFLDDYEEMIRDAVVLGANDTSDTGTARYYDEQIRMVDEYKETQSEDGLFVGYLALSIINARHGIVARDPWHTWVGDMDGRYEDNGNVYLTVLH